MKDLDVGARVAWAVTVACGLVANLIAIPSAAAAPFPWVAALIFFAGFVADSFQIEYGYKRGRNRPVGSLSAAISVASFLILAPALAIIVNVGYYLLAELRQRVAWYKYVFNLAQRSLAIGIAGSVWHRFGGGLGSSLDPEDLFWLIVALGLYFLINSGLVSLMVARADRLPWRYVWLRAHRRVLPPYLGTLFGGALIAHLWAMSPWSVLLAIVPLVAIYYAFEHTIALEQQTLSALFDLADILDQRDYYTHQHSVRVGEQAEKLALQLGLPAEESYLIYLCGRLHDIGKCAINNEVLLKPGPLTPEEREHMCRHAEVGGQMLAHFGMFRVGATYVRGHHEWYDGSGYPDRLKGEQIPLGARVIAVADAYDAMTTTRPYRQALPRDEAIRRLRAGHGIQWDPVVVDAYLDLLAEPSGKADPADAALVSASRAARLE